MAETAAKKKHYLGTGRRKTSVARVRMFDGAGKLTINARPLDSYFTEVKDRNAVMAALEVTENVGKMDVFVNVKGGGFSGQAGAISQGLARALKTLYTPATPETPVDGEPPVIPAMIKKLRDSWARKKPIEWVRVHFLPRHAHFPHSRHIKALGPTACQTCHGDVTRMAQVFKANEIGNMGWCISCHLERNISRDCTVCHY